MIFPGGFLISLGTLTRTERDFIVDLHAKKVSSALNPAKREMKPVRWFKVTDFLDALTVRSFLPLCLSWS